MLSSKRILVIFVTVMVVGMVAQAADHRILAQPYDELSGPGEPSFDVPYAASARSVEGDEWLIGADHILEQQCDNGGFGWEHADCSATYHNITGPILLGVLDSYLLSNDLNHLVGAMNGGAFDLTSTYANGESRFGSSTAWFMSRLAEASDNTTFADFAATGFFGALEAGTYGPDDLDTAGWIAAVQTARTGTWVNLRPWEFSTLVPTAAFLGTPAQQDLFVQAVLDGLATLDNTDPDNVYSDLLGVAGAIRGLAFAGVTSFPAIVAPLHDGVNGIATLEDLAAYLASHQNPDGSWYWHSNLTTPTTGDEDVQTTAYAVLALLEADPLTTVRYLPAAQVAADWLVSLQGEDGGIPAYPGGGENTEVEGEAMSAIATTVIATRIFDDGFETGDTGRWSLATP